MSATNRGPRLGGADDFYETPAWCVHRFLEKYPKFLGRCLDPCAGEGAIVKACYSFGKPGLEFDPGNWTCVEIRHTPTVGEYRLWADFLRLDRGDFPLVGTRIDTVISNPPYKLAEEFIRKSIELFPNASVIFLLRLNFLASRSRLALYRDIGVPDVYVLPNRPSFSDNGKTDATEYAWFVWDPDYRKKAIGELTILDDTPRSQRSQR